VSDSIVRVAGLRKVFSYVNPDPNSNDADMWIAYLLGLLGRSTAKLAARRGTFIALDGVDLEVQRGEFLAVLGTNGAGKTTLVKILSTTLTPTAGSVVVNGFDVARAPARVRASVSVVPSTGWLAFDHELSLVDNLTYWARLYGLDRKTAEWRVREAVEVVGLGSWLREKPGHLSSGMRQRLAIAKGLVFRAPVFILDEPTANVDAVGAVQIRDFLRNELNRRLGQTVILTTHNLAEAEQLADRVAIIERGKVIACDRPANLTADLRGQILDIAFQPGPSSPAQWLRERDLVCHAVDTTDERGVCHLRIQLRSGVTAEVVRREIEIAGSVVREVSAVQPTLEDLFIRLAGR
jgi:ABC-2 type transport system ATP-binding protein